MSYRTYGPLDDPIRTEGDQGFLGVDTYLEPEMLKPGFCQAAHNMRMNGDLASVRKGLDFLAGSVTLTYSSGDEQVFAAGMYSDPDDDNKNWLLVATKTKAIIWNKSTTSGLNVNYDTGTNPTVTTAQNPTIVQANNKVYIMRLGQRPLIWDGNTAATGVTVNSEFEVLSASASGSGDPFPSTDYAIWFRNRMIGIQPPTVATPTTAKTGSSIVVMSDLLDVNNIVSSESEFYIGFGSNDHCVGIIGYQDNQIFVFNRRSIHLISNVHATSISEHYELTREFGCVARRTIAQSGSQTYFLSDKGVYIVTPGLDPAKGMGVAVSKAQGEATPLSRPMQDEFDEVNMVESVVSKASAVVFDNKYFIAVPTGSDTVAKTVFVYDILLEAWVSKDTYPQEISGWVVMPYGSNPEKDRLFAVGPTGFYLMEENAGLDDSGREIGSTSESGTTAIAGKLKTRSFSFGDLDVKRWKRGQLGVNVVNNDAFTIKVNTTDPDASETVLSHVATGTEEALLRFGARTRGYSCNVEIDVTAGSPSFRHVSIDATDNSLNARREVA